VALMHFEGAAAHWLQSVLHRVHSMSWEQFCSSLHDMFRRDQHEALIRQLFHIKQSGLVAYYVDWFSTLVDQLAAYESTDNPLYYEMRFVDGLRDDIKLMVMIQRPSTLDTSCVLAMVQEEAMDANKRRDGRRFEPSFHRVAPKLAFPLLIPPVLDKQSSSNVAEDKRLGGAHSSDDKRHALKQYHRARGLCDRCAEKWVPRHRCAPTSFMPYRKCGIFCQMRKWQQSLKGQQQVIQLSYTCFSEVAVTGVESVHSMRLMADIQGHQVVMLVDLGSSHSFINSSLAKHCAGMSVLPRALSVSVVSGDSIQCGYQFKSIQ
jgi:hypothetical protein